MKDLKGYVISTSSVELMSFLKQINKEEFCLIDAIHPSSLTNEDKSIYFNIQKSTEILGREISIVEIAKTLSHIKCWREISQDVELAEQGFALIAESDVKLVSNFYQASQEYARIWSRYGIIKLQRTHFSILDQEAVYNGQESLSALVYGNGWQYDGAGSSLYLIRKDVAKQLILKLEKEKPYWVADNFSHFYDYHQMAQAGRFLAEMPIKKVSKNRPRFSIIIPVYNVERYLTQCVESVLQQDSDDYEIILVDDGSTDYSSTICQQYIKNYPNIFYIRKRNNGLSSARNIGIHLAKGDYILFLDSDDYWSGRQVLSDLEKIIEQHNPQLILNTFTNLYLSNNELSPRLIDATNLGNDFRKDFKCLIQREIWLGFPWTKIVKRDLINQYQLYFEEGRYYEDILWSPLLAQAVQSYAIYSNPFYVYRRNRLGAITASINLQKVKDLLFAYKKNQALLNNFSDDFAADLRLAIFPKGNDYLLKCYALLSTKEQELLKEDVEEVSKYFDL